MTRKVSLEKSVSSDVEAKGIALVPYGKYRALKCEENLRRKQALVFLSKGNAASGKSVSREIFRNSQTSKKNDRDCFFSMLYFLRHTRADDIFKSNHTKSLLTFAIDIESPNDV